MKECKQCKLSALCLPRGRLNLIWNQFKYYAKKCALPLNPSAFQVMTRYAKEEQYIKEARAIWYRVLEKFPCAGAGSDIVVSLHRNADIYSLKMSNINEEVQ